MVVARHGSGPVAAVRALRSQVHPVFMIPPVAASLFGATLATGFGLRVALLHATAVFFALYTAHVKDGYVDFYLRGEDDDHPLTATGCRIALALASVAFLACTVALAVVVDVWAALVTLPGWLIGYHHAPQLDTNPVTATTGYPTGIALALAGGVYVQERTVPESAAALAAVFLVVLSGIKVIDDATDYEYDRSIGKRTVAVILGPRRARTVAFGLMSGGVLAVVVLALGPSTLPTSAVGASVAFAAVALAVRDAEPAVATSILIRGSYVFLVVLALATWFRPLE